MLKNPKAKGSRNELRAKKTMEEKGWWVIKAGGSLGVWDLACLSPNGLGLLIQVKTNRRPDKKEMATLKEFPFPYKELWIYHDREKEPTVEVIYDLVANIRGRNHV